MVKITTQTFKTLLFSALLLCCGLSAKAQQFSQTAPYDTLVIEHDTLDWYITSPVITGAWGNVSVTVMYEGDFGFSSEFITIYGEDGSVIGVTQPYFDGSDCMQDSVVLTFPSAMLSTWGADNSIHIYGVSSDEVNIFCTGNQARIRVDYNYCATGGDVAFFSLPVTAFCAVDDAVTFTATPAGGILTGPGLSATEFDPSGLAPGDYTLTYTYENEEGCVSYQEIVVVIKEGAVATASDYTICPLETVVLTSDASGHVQWFSDLALTDSIGSGGTLSVDVPETSNYYAAVVLNENYFTLNSLDSTSFVVADIDTIAGDDRGGIAVTTDYIYMTGDDMTVRYDLDLQNPVGFPRTDALFSDLGTGDLYTLYNPLVGLPDANVIDNMYITEIRALNDDLTLGTTTITLSDSIPFGYDQNYDYQSGILAGNGFLMVYSAPDSTFYAIDLQDGVVTDLGQTDPAAIHAYYSESWSFWGIAEFTENGYAALYSDNNTSNILRWSVTDGTSTVFAQFEDMNDMASFTYAPWNNRFYFHYEGGGQFDPEGNISELLGYMGGEDSTGLMTFGGTLGCPAEVTITVNSTDIELTATGTACIGDPAVTLTATPAGGTFSGAGVTGNTFDPNIAGTGTHTVLYTYMDAGTSCENYDSLVFVVDCFTGLEETAGAQLSLYPNPATESLNIGFGNSSSAKATFRVFDASGRLMLTQSSNGSALQTIDVSTLGNGTYLLHVSGETEARKLFSVTK